MSSPVERLEEWCDSKTTNCLCDTCVAEPVSPMVEAYRHLIARYRLKEKQANDLTLHIRLQEQRAAEAQELEHVIAVIEEAVNPEEK